MRKLKQVIVKCKRCGKEFPAQMRTRQYCPACLPLRRREITRANYDPEWHRKYCLDAYYAEKAEKALSLAAIRKGRPPVFSYKEIRARKRGIKVEAGWRGQKCAGGGGQRITILEVAQ